MLQLSSMSYGITTTLLQSCTATAAKHVPAVSAIGRASCSTMPTLIPFNPSTKHASNCLIGPMTAKAINNS